MKAITFNLLAWVMLPIMDGFAKYLSAELPVLQITWARYFFTVAFTFPVMLLLKFQLPPYLLSVAKLYKK